MATRAFPICSSSARATMGSIVLVSTVGGVQQPARQRRSARFQRRWRRDRFAVTRLAGHENHADRSTARLDSRLQQRKVCSLSTRRRGRDVAARAMPNDVHTLCRRWLTVSCEVLHVALRHPTIPLLADLTIVNAATILVVDDDPAVRLSIRDLLQRAGFAVREADSCAAGVAAFRSQRPDIVLVEHRLPDGDGVHLIGQLRATDPDVPCIVLSGHGTIDLAVQALKEGAENFITKPIKSGLLETLIPRLLQQQASRKRTIVQDVREARADLDPFLGTSPAIRALAEDARTM